MNGRRRIGLLLCGALVLAVVLCLNSRADETSAPEEHAREPERGLRPRGTGRLPSRAEFLRLLAAQQEPESGQPAGLHTNHPHPITSDHVRLYRDVDLLHAADEAIKAGAYDRARALLAQHHRELAGMSAVEEEGLLLLADCAEYGGAEHIERVRNFYEEHTDSTVRRRLRRACLERERVR